MKNPFKKTPKIPEIVQETEISVDEEYEIAIETANGTAGFESEAVKEIEKHKKII